VREREWGREREREREERDKKERDCCMLSTRGKLE
jgi:hypothetical protein